MCKKKYIKKYNFRKKYSYLPKMWGKKKEKSVTWKISVSSKKCKKNFFPMPSHRRDVDGFKSGLFLLPYGPLEPMVITFTCDLSLALFLSAFRRADPLWEIYWLITDTKTESLTVKWVFCLKLINFYLARDMCNYLWWPSYVCFVLKENSFIKGLFTHTNI